MRNSPRRIGTVLRRPATSCYWMKKGKSSKSTNTCTGSRILCQLKNRPIAANTNFKAEEIPPWTKTPMDASTVWRGRSEAGGSGMRRNQSADPEGFSGGVLYRRSMIGVLTHLGFVTHRMTAVPLDSRFRGNDWRGATPACAGMTAEDGPQDRHSRGSGNPQCAATRSPPSFPLPGSGRRRRRLWERSR